MESTPPYLIAKIVHPCQVCGVGGVVDEKEYSGALGKVFLKVGCFFWRVGLVRHAASRRKPKHFRSSVEQIRQADRSRFCEGVFFWAGLRKPFGGDGFHGCHCQASAPGSQQDGSHTARAQGFEDKEGADSGEEHRVANRGGVQVGGDGAGAGDQRFTGGGGESVKRRIQNAAPV